VFPVNIEFTVSRKAASKALEGFCQPCRGLDEIAAGEELKGDLL